METMKFLMTSTFYPPYHLGGDAVHVKYLAEELARRGHEVHVIFSRDAYRLKRGDKPQEDRGGKVHLHPLDSPFGRLSPAMAYALGNSGHAIRSYRRLAAEIKPDVVHHHNVSLLGHGLFKRDGRYIQLYTAHDHWLMCQASNMLRNGQPCDGRGCAGCAIRSGRPPQFWRRWMDLSGLDCIISPSKYLAGRLSKLGANITVIPNFSPEPPWNIPDIPGDDFYLFVGVIDEHKGVKILLDAFSESENRLVILGRGSLAPHLRKTISKRKLSPRIQYLGWKDDDKKLAYLKKARALLIPSTCPENLPFVALEAMSVGTPVVCSDLGGAAEAASLLSKKLVIPAGEMRRRLSNLSIPDIPRETVMAVFAANFTAEIYMGKYMAILKEGCTSTS